MVNYNDRRYPSHIKSEITEVAGNFDKEAISCPRPYSLHTEYSYMPRDLNNHLLENLDEIKVANKDGIPQLWKSKQWAEEFFCFLARLIKDNPPEIIEIHPPFSDYCNSICDFLEIYSVFESLVTTNYPQTSIYVENRFGTLYRKGEFIICTGADIIELCKELEKRKLRLKIVLDYPQLCSGVGLNMNALDIEPIIQLNADLQKYACFIGGIHIWGKKKSAKGRWTPHNGNLRDFFETNSEQLNDYLLSINKLFNDDIYRHLVLEVNSAESDIFSIVQDLEGAGFVFRNNSRKAQQFIGVQWGNDMECIADIQLFDSLQQQYFSVPLKLGDYFSISRTNRKHCIGTYASISLHTPQPCPQNQTLTDKKVRCDRCTKNFEFTYCMRCHGEVCTAKKPETINYCNEAHFLYLAVFPEHLVKVGTVNAKRKFSRLLEQGALCSYILTTEISGKTARQLEYEISKLGYSMAVRSDYKIKHLQIHDSEAMLFALNNALKKIRLELKREYLNSFLQQPELIIFSKQIDMLKSLAASSGQLSLFQECTLYKYIVADSNLRSIEGRIKAIWGSILVLETINGDIAIDLKKFIGYESVVTCGGVDGFST